jgi:parallel beta-helix repeat protein
MSVKASLRTWTVDDDGLADFHTIQAAVSRAGPGDTVFVHSGTYFEHFAVDKRLSLIGEDRDFTIVNGNETGSIINVTANYVSIQNFTIRKSGVRPPYNSGIRVEYSTDSVISHNRIEDNYDGISLYYSSRNVVSDNMVTNNYNGISFYSSSNNVVSDNVVSSNSYNGLNLYSSSNNVISDNVITANSYNGINLVLYSGSNVLSSNIIFRNSAGINFALYSSNNMAYHNDFNNTVQAQSSSTNTWDNGYEGNHWSDYMGSDSNGNGLGNVPYFIDMNNLDNYPLMGAFYEFNVTLRRGSYAVAVICNSTVSGFTFDIGIETGNEMIHFTVTGENGTVGFCRVTIPTELMDYPYIVLVGEEEVTPTLLSGSNETRAHLYFAYTHSNRSIAIISSKTLRLYEDLIDQNAKLRMDLSSLNMTYHDLLSTYYALLYNYTQLQETYRALNSSYQGHLSDYSENVQNIRNLMYIFAAATAILLMTTVYLSKSAHAGSVTKSRMSREEE